MGELTLQVPQVRGEVEFYPSALERGVRSERALKCAIAEMYVQGVSTRKITAVMSELCGLEVSSTQVSRATRLLEEELERWRNRPRILVSITGQVLAGGTGGTGLAGTTVSLTGASATGTPFSHSTTTNANGSYTLFVPLGGSYTVTPSLAG